MTTKPELPIEEINRRLAAFPFPEVDWIAGILTGGLVPAFLVAQRIQRPVVLISVNYRDDNNDPVAESPRLLSAVEQLPQGKRVLLVDDVSVSGKTVDFARSQLQGYTVTSFVMKGKGDLVLFPEVKGCVLWPWKKFPHSIHYKGDPSWE